MKASWDYLEPGHGKGPCDGLGASVKRSADSSIKQEKAAIQNAADFFRWATEIESNTVVSYYYVSTQDYTSSEAHLLERTKGLKAIPGTMQIHAAAPINLFEIALRKVSCHCNSCMRYEKESMCEGWSFHRMKETMDVDQEPILEHDEDTTNEQESNTHDESVDTHQLQEGQFIIAMYEGFKCVGRITSVGKQDGDAKITFMKESSKRKNAFIWPSPKDEVWIEFKNILSVIDEPLATGKSK